MSDLRPEGWTYEKSLVRCVVCPDCAFTFDAWHTDTGTDAYSCPVCEAARLRTVVRRLFDGWVICNNCDPGDEQEWAWEWSGLVAPGSFDFKREPFEPGVEALLWTFDPLDEGTPDDASSPPSTHGA